MGSSIIVDFTGGPFDGKTWFSSSVPALDDPGFLSEHFDEFCFSDEYDDEATRLLAIYLDWLAGNREIVVETLRKPAFEHSIEEAGQSFSVGEKYLHFYEATECLRDGSEVLLSYRFVASKRRFFVKDFERIEEHPYRKTCDFF